jgi:ribosomal protein S18 acetylase RimI-like enzyme
MKQSELSFRIREMTIEDYDQVRGVWMGIHGFRIRSIDDSREGVERFLRRNPTTSMVAVCEDRIVGAILCGHDGRRGCLYHVCVQEEYRQHGIGRALAESCMRALQREQINVVSLIAFKENTLGNHFWHGAGWNFREDLNYYDFILNDENISTKV